MSEQTKKASPIIPILVLILMLGITIIFFFSFVSYDARNIYFYVSLFVICAAEFVFFGWFINRYLTVEKKDRVSTPTFLTLYSVISIWFIITVLFVLISLVTQFKYEKFQVFLIIIYSVVTILLLFGSSMFYQQDKIFTDRSIKGEKEKEKYIRKEISVSQLRNKFNDLLKIFPNDNVQVDRLGKRLESLEMKLRHITPSKYRQGDRELPPEIDSIEKNILDEIKQLESFISSIAEGDSTSKLSEIENKLNSLENSISQRQQLLL